MYFWCWISDLFIGCILNSHISSDWILKPLVFNFHSNHDRVPSSCKVKSDESDFRLYERIQFFRPHLIVRFFSTSLPPALRRVHSKQYCTKKIIIPQIKVLQVLRKKIDLFPVENFTVIIMRVMGSHFLLPELINAIFSSYVTIWK